MFQHFYAEGTEAYLTIDVKVDPDKQVYCFFGRNGAGKTLLLENLGKALILDHAMFGHRATKDSVRASLRGLINDGNVHFALAELVLRAVPTAIQLDSVDSKTATEGWMTAQLKDLETRAHMRPPGHKFVDRPIVAISARERGFTENLTSNRIRLLGDRSQRFIQAFLRTYQVITRQMVEVESLAEWLIARVIVNPTVTGDDDRSFEVQTVLKLMEELDPVEFRGLSDRTSGGVPNALRFTEGKLWLGKTPIDKLPSGFVSIIKLFQEILGGYAGWTAFQGQKNLAEVDGIVLIDEIESHLHPMWQAKILPLLKRYFPRTTFYVCTHSPLVVATTAEGEAYELVKNEKRITANRLGNPRAWYLADVYEQAFHVELPPTDDAMNLPDLLLDFSIKVKDHLRTKDPAVKAEAEKLYERIVPSVPPTDPRRSSVEALKGMLQ